MIIRYYYHTKPAEIDHDEDRRTKQREFERSERHVGTDCDDETPLIRLTPGVGDRAGPASLKDYTSRPWENRSHFVETDCCHPEQ
jgi:hypothetical protein